jgi:hypothetical protein
MNCITVNHRQWPLKFVRCSPRAVTLVPPIVAAGVEAMNRPVVLIEDFTVRSDHKASARPEVARFELDRVEGRPLDRPKAGVGRMSGIALECVISCRSFAKILIDSGRGKPIDAIDRALEPQRVDADLARQLMQCSAVVQVTGLLKAPERLRAGAGRTGPTPYFLMAAASALRKAGIAPELNIPSVKA